MLKGRCPIDKEDRAKAVVAVVGLLDRVQVTEKSGPRAIIAAARALATFDQINMEQEKRDAGGVAGDHLHLHHHSDEMTVEELAKLPVDQLVRLHRESLGLPLPTRPDEATTPPHAEAEP